MSELILYTSDDGKTHLNLKVEGNTLWLTQLEMAELFQRSKKTVSEHLGNLFAEGELQESAVVRNFRTTASNGKNYRTQLYNLDLILAIGYRVRSPRGGRDMACHVRISVILQRTTGHGKPCPYMRAGLNVVNDVLM